MARAEHATETFVDAIGRHVDKVEGIGKVAAGCSATDAEHCCSCRPSVVASATTTTFRARRRDQTHPRPRTTHSTTCSSSSALTVSRGTPDHFALNGQVFAGPEGSATWRSAGVSRSTRQLGGRSPPTRRPLCRPRASDDDDRANGYRRRPAWRSMSRQRKRDALLRLLRGEDLDMVSRSLGRQMARSARATASRRASARCCSSANCRSRRSPCWRATKVLWGAEGRGDEPQVVAQQWRAVRPRTRLPDLAQRTCEHLPAPPSGADAAETGSRRPDAGCGPAGTDRRRPLRQALSRRTPPEGLGSVAHRWRAYLAAPRAAAHARE